MSKSFPLLVLACAVLALGVLWGYSADAPAAKEKAIAVGPKWEYKVINPDTLKPQEIEKELNTLGAEGWELVSFASSPGNANTQIIHFRAVLKRPKKK